MHLDYIRIMERKTATVQVRFTPTIKDKAESVLDGLGLTPTTAIELFYKQIIAYNGLPFSPKVVNAVTAKAMNETKDRDGKSFTDVNELFEELEL